jgi:hypothetical protein
MGSGSIHPAAVVLRAVSAAVLSARVVAAKGVRSTKRRRNAEFELVRDSSLFDPKWYLRRYPDVARARTDPLTHYMTLGWREGRDPGPGFATSAYLKANADVARSDVNPLLHYIEFGHAEGRGIFDHRPLPQQKAATLSESADPAPCVSFAIPDERAVKWRRAYRLDGSRPDALTVEDHTVGYVAADDVRATFQAAFARLALLSGVAGAAIHAAEAAVGPSVMHLVDGWHAGSGQFRTRWSAEQYPLVIRAFQYDASGNLVRVGDTLTASSIDINDFQLTSPFFPLLFVFAQPDGNLLGFRFLAFPSLCRGGAHYSEWLHSANSEGALDLLSESERLSDRLERVLRLDELPAIADIRIDLDGADGSHLVFQSDFKFWLKQVARIAIRPTQPCGRSPAAQLLETAETGLGNIRSADGATLVLPHDTIPTIAALTASAEQTRRSARQRLVPLLISGPDPSQGATLLDPPAGLADVLDQLAPHHPSAWPRLVPGRSGQLPDEFPTAGIRRSRRTSLTDAELFTPEVRQRLPAQAVLRRPITWLIETAGWRKDQLVSVLHTVALQHGGDADRICFVGPVERDIVAAANHQFAGVMAVRALAAAVSALETPLAGYLGERILLHDNRTADVLAKLLESDAVATASCVLLSVERGGIAWHPSIADTGQLEGDDALQPAEATQRAEQIWQNIYPVAAPTKDLWMARSDCLGRWLDDPPVRTIEGFHICSSLVTASYLGKPPGFQAAATVPPPARHALRLEELLG